MPDVNPYASPTYGNEQWLPRPDSDLDGAIFRQGKLLVMNKRARLPDRCVKSNCPTARRLKRKLVWCHPAVYLALPLGLPGFFLYILLSLVFQKRAKIEIGLCDEWFRRRRRAMLIGWGSFPGVVMGIVLIVSRDDWSHSSPLVVVFILLLGLAGILLGLAGIFYGMFASRMIVPKRITRELVWIRGVHPDFLDTLPPWPYDS